MTCPTCGREMKHFWVDQDGYVAKFFYCPDSPDSPIRCPQPVVRAKPETR